MGTPSGKSILGINPSTAISEAHRATTDSDCAPLRLKVCGCMVLLLLSKNAEIVLSATTPGSTQAHKQRIGHTPRRLQHLHRQGGEQAPAAAPASAQAVGVIELAPLHKKMFGKAQHQAQLQRQALR